MDTLKKKEEWISTNLKLMKQELKNIIKDSTREFNITADFRGLPNDTFGQVNKIAVSYIGDTFKYRRIMYDNIEDTLKDLNEAIQWITGKN